VEKEEEEWRRAMKRGACEDEKDEGVEMVGVGAR
jgi:hypothetical protein